VDKKAKFFKIQYLSGTSLRICGRYKRESRAHYPGRSGSLPKRLFLSRGREKDGQKSAEAIVGPINGTEGPNMRCRCSTSASHSYGVWK